MDLILNSIHGWFIYREWRYYLNCLSAEPSEYPCGLVIRVTAYRDAVLRQQRLRLRIHRVIIYSNTASALMAIINPFYSFPSFLEIQKAIIISLLFSPGKTQIISVTFRLNKWAQICSVSFSRSYLSSYRLVCFCLKFLLERTRPLKDSIGEIFKLCAFFIDRRLIVDFEVGNCYLALFILVYFFRNVPV